MVILLQTDTLWGLSADARDCDEVRKIFELKKRPISREKSFLMLMSGWKMVEQYAYLPEGYDLNELEGVSIVLKVRSGTELCPLVVRDNTIGVRVPSSMFLKRFVSSLGYPLVTTSANIHGQPSPLSLEQVPLSIREYVEDIISNPENIGETEPSTIVDLASGSPTILRKGKNWKKIVEVLGILP